MATLGKGALDSIGVLDGITPRAAEELTHLGYATVHDLASLTPEKAAGLAAVVAGLSEAKLIRAIQQSWFHLVSEDAALLSTKLIDSRVSTPWDLVAQPTQHVVNLAGTGWDRERAATLQLEAARHLLTFITLLRVTNADGVGKARVKVEVPDSGLADRRPATLHLGDGQGWVVLPPLRRDRRHHLVVIESGRRRSLWVTAPKAPVLRTTLRLGVPPRPVASGSSTPTRVYSDGVTFVNEAIPLNKVRDGEVFEVIMTDKGFDLVGVASSVHSGVAVTRVATLPSDALPGTIRPASFVTFADGVWRRSSVAEKRKALKSRGGALRERLLP